MMKDLHRPRATCVRVANSALSNLPSRSRFQMARDCQILFNPLSCRPNGFIRRAELLGPKIFVFPDLLSTPFSDRQPYHVVNPDISSVTIAGLVRMHLHGDTPKSHAVENNVLRVRIWPISLAIFPPPLAWCPIFLPLTDDTRIRRPCKCFGLTAALIVATALVVAMITNVVVPSAICAFILLRIRRLPFLSRCPNRLPPLYDREQRGDKYGERDECYSSQTKRKPPPLSLFLCFRIDARCRIMKIIRLIFGG